MSNPKTVKRGWMAALIVLSILIIDQIIKFWVKTHMTLHEQIEFFSWFKIVFIENNGMAYGMEIGSKLVLSIFRIMAISMFYGLIFNASSEYYASYFVPFGTGYAPFLMGKVVDMFYFPLIVTTWPDWVPFVGGEPYVFFSPIFNFADSAISVGVVLLLLFYRREIGELSLKKEAKESLNKDTEESLNKESEANEA